MQFSVFQCDTRKIRLITAPLLLLDDRKKREREKKKQQEKFFIIQKVFVAIFLFNLCKTLHHRIKTIAAKLIKMVQAHSVCTLVMTFMKLSLF